MKILGIDPGIGRLGWSVIEANGSKIEALNFGCIETSLKLETQLRLAQIYSEINKIIKKYQPDVFVIEDLFFGANAKTALIVGEARGVILLCAGQNKLQTVAYTPLQVKVAVAGYGKADKEQVNKMVKILLKLKTMPKLDDTVDAMAIALTHAFSHKSRAL